MSFEPLLEALRCRTMHIMGRLYTVTEFMLQREGDSIVNTTTITTTTTTTTTKCNPYSSLLL